MTFFKDMNMTIHMIYSDKKNVEISSEYIIESHHKTYYGGRQLPELSDRFSGIHKKGGGVNDRCRYHFDIHRDNQLADYLR